MVVDHDDTITVKRRGDGTAEISIAPGLHGVGVRNDGREILARLTNIESSKAVTIRVRHELPSEPEPKDVADAGMAPGGGDVPASDRSTAGKSALWMGPQELAKKDIGAETHLNTSPVLPGVPFEGLKGWRGDRGGNDCEALRDFPDRGRRVGFHRSPGWDLP